MWDRHGATRRGANLRLRERGNCRNQLFRDAPASIATDFKHQAGLIRTLGPSFIEDDAMTSGRVTVSDGVEIHYELLGSGSTTLVFTPGWSFPHDVFVHQMASLPERYRCLFYDPRGQGRSTVGLLGNNYTQHGHDLAALLDALGLDDVILVSWSYGVLAAYSFVRHFGSSKVRGFVCVDEPAKPMSGEPGDWCEGAPEVLGELLRAVQPGQRAFLSDYAQHMVARPLTVEEQAWIVDMGCRTPAHAAAALFADGHFSDYISEARELDLSVPCMTFVRAEVTCAAMNWLAANTPRTRVEVLPSHMMFWEDSAKFNALLSDFVESSCK